MSDPHPVALPAALSDLRTAPLLAPGWMVARLPATMPAPLPPAAGEGDEVPPAVGRWLMKLHGLCAGRSTAEEATARIWLVTPLLAGRYPVDAFTMRSLEHVAARCKFWPSYAELVEHLGGWWMTNRPRVPVVALAATQDSEPLSAEERERMAARMGEMTAEMIDRIRSRDAAARPAADSARADMTLDAFQARRVERAEKLGHLKAASAARNQADHDARAACAMQIKAEL